MLITDVANTRRNNQGGPLSIWSLRALGTGKALVRLRHVLRGSKYHADDGTAEVSLNFARVYPPQVSLDSCERTVRLDRLRKQVEVIDSSSLTWAPIRNGRTLTIPHEVLQTTTGELSVVSGSFSREQSGSALTCRARIICADATIGSLSSSGLDPRLPMPRIVMSSTSRRSRFNRPVPCAR